jgi:hypothetical protein
MGATGFTWFVEPSSRDYPPRERNAMTKQTTKTAGIFMKKEIETESENFLPLRQSIHEGTSQIAPLTCCAKS